MHCRLTGPATLLIATLASVTTARAEIVWDYEKPSSERSVGSLLSDILGLSAFGKDYAVIVGLHRFEDFNPLDATENDPQRMFEFLRDEAGFDYILVLRDDEVTYQKLRSLFEHELPRVLGPNDRFLLFWSGHGTQFPDARGVELGYLPLISSPADDKSTMVAMRDFARWDNELPAKHALFLLDACFSGLAGSTVQSDERDLEIRELAKPGHHIISAGGRDQQTIASRQEWQGSIFTDALLKALRGHADRYGGAGEGDGVINLYELVADIGETVKNAKAAAGWKRPLRPVLNVFRGEGQFFFLTKERKRAYLEAQGKQVSDDLAYGMPVVVMGVNDPGDPGSERAAGDLAQDFQVWSFVQNSSNPIDLQTFIEAFPDSVWVPFARNRLSRLRAGEAPQESAALAPMEEVGPTGGEPPNAVETAPTPVSVVDHAAIERALGLSRDQRREVQFALSQLGHDPGSIDGILGERSRAGIAAWQQAAGDEPTGYLTERQVVGLVDAVDPAELAALPGPAGDRDTERMLALFRRGVIGQGELNRFLEQRRATPVVGVYPEPLAPGAVFQDCAECPEMVVVPAGEFMMGSLADELAGYFQYEGPQHGVTIARPFAVGKYEVTFDEWDACVADGGCSISPYDGGWGRGDRPVIHISWNLTQEYVAWLSERTGKPYRLLSESEWEYVARAGTNTPYWWGRDVGRRNANCSGCGSDWDGKQTAPVGSFEVNPFGLHDTSGNVLEWVEDCSNKTYEGAPSDGSAWTDKRCLFRMQRGGSWASLPRDVRSAYRKAVIPTGANGYFGFRVARALD